MFDRQLLKPLMVGMLAVSLASAAIAVAEPNLVSGPAHRHYVVNESGGMSEVGPDLCDNLDDPAIQHAFNEFHNNVHRATDPNAHGAPAPGLHNGKGGE